MQAMLIKGGRVIDPAVGSDGPGDVHVAADGRIAAPPVRMPSGARVVDARGCVVAPALIDLHVHLREPGDEEAETVATGTQAAARGGFSTLLAMPNTKPPMDNAEAVRTLLERAAAAGPVRVLPCGCLSRMRAGRECADLEAMAGAGARAFSDDGGTPAEEEVLRAAMQHAARLGLPVVDHAELSAGAVGVMHAGPVAKRLGLPGIPAEVELRAVERDIRLSRETGCRVHIQHVSTAGAMELIAAALDEGLPVSGEVTPHHLALCDEDVRSDDTHFKMNPPLRSRVDRDALRKGVMAGVLAVLATDHAPHTHAAKARGFLSAPFGIIGLETAVALTYQVLVQEEGLPLMEWLSRWTLGPASVLGLPPPTLAPGAPADLVVFDLDREWRMDPSKGASLSGNTPFVGWTLTGRAMLTLVGGRSAWCDPQWDRSL